MCRIFRCHSQRLLIYKMNFQFFCWCYFSSGNSQHNNNTEWVEIKCGLNENLSDVQVFWTVLLANWLTYCLSAGMLAGWLPKCALCFLLFAWKHRINNFVHSNLFIYILVLPLFPFHFIYRCMLLFARAKTWSINH